MLVRPAPIGALERGAGTPAVGSHRAELVEHERLAVATDASLPQHERPAEADRDHQRDDEQEGNEHDEQDERENAVDHRLDESLVAGLFARRGARRPGVARVVTESGRGREQTRAIRGFGRRDQRVRLVRRRVELRGGRCDDNFRATRQTS